MAGEFFGPNVFSGGRNEQSARARHLDMLIGFLAFFGLLSFVWTVYSEVTGDDAVLEAFILLCLVLAIVGLWRVRRRLN